MGKYLFTTHALVDAPFENKSIESIIKECGNVNALYYDCDTQVYHELNDVQFQIELLNRLQIADLETGLTLRIDDLPVCIGITKKNDSFCISLSDYTMNRSKQFKFIYAENTIPAVRLLLKLTNGFVLKNIMLLSELQIFPKGVGTNIIAGAVLSGEKQETVDLLIDIAIDNNYHFIENLYSERLLEYGEISKQIMIGLKKNSESQLFVKVEDTVSILRISNGYVLSIIPQVPYRIKTADGKSGVDLAFYTKILLNLAEPFGMDEMEANFESMQE